jgi:hypothetical protein
MSKRMGAVNLRGIEEGNAPVISCVDQRDHLSVLVNQGSSLNAGSEDLHLRQIPGFSLRTQEHLTAAALIHGLVAFGGLIEGEVEDLGVRRGGIPRQ